MENHVLSFQEIVTKFLEIFVKNTRNGKKLLEENYSRNLKKLLKKTSGKFQETIINHKLYTHNETLFRNPSIIYTVENICSVFDSRLRLRCKVMCGEQSTKCDVLEEKSLENIFCGMEKLGDFSLSQQATTL